MPRVHVAEIEQTAREWQRAFEAAHDKAAPPVYWERGWFRIDHGGWAPRYRRATLEAMTKTLRKGFTQS